MSGHALRSPSWAYCWSVCTAAPLEKARLIAEQEALAQEARDNAEATALLFGLDIDVESFGETDDSNEASRWGTACHLLSETCLVENRDPAEFEGKWVHIPEPGGEVIENKLPTSVLFGKGHAIEIDEEQVECATTYVEFIRKLRDDHGATLLVEQRVSIEHITGEEGAGGTSDAILYVPQSRELIVGDLKGGMSRVDAFTTTEVIDPIFGSSTLVTEPNKQLAMYADGALEEFGWMFGEIERVRLVIIQPRLNHVSEYSLPVAELKQHIEALRLAAEAGRTSPVYAPGAKTCKFCPAQATCGAFREAALVAALGGFENVDEVEQHKPIRDDLIAIDYEALPLIRMFVKSVEDRMKELLRLGQRVIGKQGEYILAEGRMGARRWTDEEKVEALLRKQFRLAEEVAYAPRKLISPTQAERLTKKPKGEDKPTLGPTQWERLAELIRQERTKPSIALASSGKNAVRPVTADFENLETKD
jgi:hypothetical protein